jgi:hypothetical protein
MSEHPLRVGLVGANAERSWAKVAHVPALGTLPEFTLASRLGWNCRAWEWPCLIEIHMHGHL